jgi:hypothetical protein
VTSYDLIVVLRRRWYVVAVGLALLAGTLHVVATRPGVYWTQVDVVVLAPKSARYPNVIEQTSASLIAMAGLVEREVNEGAHAPATASASVTLAGEGVRDGSSVTMPNSGGQWAADFSRPVIDVQVVGPSEATVRRRLAVLVGRIERTLAARQAADHVPPVSRITASSSPTSAAVMHLEGSTKKALAATLLLGGALVAAAAVGADLLLTNRTRRVRVVRAPQPLGGKA